MRVCLLKLERCNVRDNPDSNYYENSEISGDIKLPALSIHDRNKVWDEIRTEFASLPNTPYYRLMMKHIWRWRVEKRKWSFDIVCATNEENSNNEEEENSGNEEDENSSNEEDENSGNEEDENSSNEDEDTADDREDRRRVVIWERGDYCYTIKNHCHFDCWVTLKIGLNPFIHKVRRYAAKSTGGLLLPRYTKQSTQVEVLLQFGNNFILFNDMDKFNGTERDGHRRIYSQKEKVITEEISNELKSCTANEIKISVFKVFKTPPLASPQTTNLPRTLEESNWQIFLEQCNTDLIIISSDMKLVDCHVALATRDSSVLSSEMAMSKRNGNAVPLLQMELTRDQITSFLRFQYILKTDMILESPRTSIAVLKAAEHYEIGGMWDTLVAALIEKDSGWFGAEVLAELKIFLNKCSKRAEKSTQDLARKLSPTAVKKPRATRAKKLSQTEKQPETLEQQSGSVAKRMSVRIRNKRKREPSEGTSGTLEVTDSVGRDTNNGIWTDKGMKATGPNDIIKAPGLNKIAVKVEKVELPEKETEETTEMDSGEDQEPGPIAIMENISCDDSAPSAEEFHIIKMELAD